MSTQNRDDRKDRRASYEERQRAMGRSTTSMRVTPAEAAKVRAYLKRLREESS